MRTEDEARPRAERWLVVSYWANVEGVAASFHIDDRLPHLAAAGIEVEVLTSVCGRRPEGWGKRWRRVPSLSPSGLRFEARYLARQLPPPWGALVKVLLTVLVLPFYAVEKLVANLESAFWWWLSGGLVGLAVTRQRGFDLIYSSGGALSGHLAAAWIARGRGIPWIAEIQDPLRDQAAARRGLARWAIMRLEQLVHTRATGVVYLTQTAAERAAARTGGPTPCRAIYAGAEAPVVRAPARDGCLRLLHAGTLSGSRTPETLLRALANLAARNGQVRREMRLTLLGAMEAKMRRMAQAFPYPEMLEARGKLPRREAREQVAGADLLLVIQNLDPVSAETIPSKTYEYLLSGRAVLGLVHRNPELAEMLREAGHRAVEGEDVAAIEAELGNLYDEWRGVGLTARTCDQYTSERAVAELVAWSRDLRAPERTVAHV